MKISFLVKMTVFFFFTLYTSANAWFIDYSFTGGMYYEDNAAKTYLQVSDAVGFDAYASWEIDDAVDDGFGGVDVTYLTEWGDNDGPVMEGHVIFSILSDFGNTTASSIAVTVNGEVDAVAVLEWEGSDMELDGQAEAEAEATNDMGAPDLSVTADGFDSIDGLILNLLTNTEYSFDVFLSAEIWAMLMSTPPEHFDSWDDYNDFIASEGESGSVFAEGSAGSFYEILIDGTETDVPEPGTMLLFATGLSGLAALRLRKK